jgi:hypothetical protein
MSNHRLHSHDATVDQRSGCEYAFLVGVVVCGNLVPAQDTYNITVRRVSVRSRSSAIKFGSTTPTDIHDLLFEDIYIFDSNGGLSIQARDQGPIASVFV